MSRPDPRLGSRASTPVERPTPVHGRPRSASSRSSRPARTAAPRSTSSRLVTRIDQTPLRRLGRGPVGRAAPSASSQRAGFPVLVIDEPDDAIAVGALAAHLAEVRAGRRPHPHVPGRDRRHAARSIALGEIGHRRPYVVSTVHSSRGPLERGPRAAPRPDAAHGPADRGLAGDRAQARRRGADDRPGPPHLQRRRPRALRPPGAVLHAARGVRHGARARRSSASSRGWSPRRATRRCSRPGPHVLRAVPDAYLLIVGEGSRGATRSRRRPRAADRPPGRLHRPPRRRPGGHRRARRRRPAVVPRGPGAVDPRGDGAVAPGRRLERRRDPRDDRGRRDGAARPAPRRRWRWRPRSSGCCATTPTPTRSGAPATTWSTTASASS